MFIVNIYVCVKFLSSPVLYTNRKYVRYVWTVLCLNILTTTNISEIYRTAYFGYFSDILHISHNLVPSASYHLTRWQKQICRFISISWVKHSNRLYDWGCESCVWIVWQYLIGSFWYYFLAWNCILFSRTICLPVYCLIKPFL